MQIRPRCMEMSLGLPVALLATYRAVYMVMKPTQKELETKERGTKSSRHGQRSRIQLFLKPSCLELRSYGGPLINFFRLKPIRVGFLSLTTHVSHQHYSGSWTRSGAQNPSIKTSVAPGTHLAHISSLGLSFLICILKGLSEMSVWQSCFHSLPLVLKL